MTKFLTYYNLCPIHDPKEFLGIAADRDPGNIITTLGRNIVVVIKISTLKQIRSWSILEKLSTKVVYDQRSQKYVGVFANSVIRCWDEAAIDINKCKKLKFKKKIADLVCYGDETLILYVDGTYENLDAAIQNRKEPSGTSLRLESNLKLTDAAVIVLPNGRQVLTYFQHSGAAGDIELVRHTLEDGSIMRFSLKRENIDVRVSGYAVIEGDNSPMLLTIWSDKRIFLLNLNDSVIPEKSPGNFVSVISGLNLDCPISVLGISQHFVAIYGANNTQEGASLLLYNTQFKVVKAKQFFKVYFDISRLWTANEHLLLAMGQYLSVVSYRMSKDMLSELVGAQISTELQTLLEGDHINEEDSLQECLQICNENSDRSIKTSNNMVISNTVKKIYEADGKLIPYEAVHIFESEFNIMTKMQMHVEALEEEHILGDVQLNLMSNFNDNGFVTQEIMVIVKQLERCGASEHEITEKILTILLRTHLLQDIAICLRRYTNISERMLAKTLSYVLNRIKPQMTVPYTKKHKSISKAIKGESGTAYNLSNCGLLTDVADYIIVDILNATLACSFDPVVIAKHVKREINYSKVVVLLEYLLNLLTDVLPSYDDYPDFTPAGVKLEMQIFRWFGVFLNTHFQKLALSKEENLVNILYQWHELFLLYKREVLELEQTSALLYNIVQRQKIFKEQNYSKWYSIEEVSLY